ncbi:hypothetical protein QP028_11370 [Corynebacterium suedekumii]|nr:hypothetical protein QP028_11370 [Corynebacterium suedekumii]
MPQLRERDITVTSEVLEASLVPAPGTVAQALGIERDEPALPAAAPAHR